MKHLLKKLAGPALGVAATVATGGLVDPGTGLALGSALVAGKVAKTHGKEVEARGGAPVHKVTAPVAAMGVPVLVVLFAQAAGIDMSKVCGVAQQIVDTVCASPELTGAAIGTGAVLLHQIFGGALQVAAGPRK